MTSVKVETDLSEQLEKLITLLEKSEEKIIKLQLLTIKEVSELTGWSKKTVQDLFNRPDFPSCDYGKEKVVEIHAIIKYFSVPRRKN